MLLSSYLKTLVILAAVLLGVLIARLFVIDGAPVVKLGISNDLQSAVSLGLGSEGDKNNLPIYKKDFTLKDIRYFVNKQWATATVVPSNPKINISVVVLHRLSNGAYQVVIGPGTAFSTNSTEPLPDTLSKYLKDKGLLYES